MTLFGPAWVARAVLGLGASAYMTVAHALYFAVPLALWLALRAIERDRLFSRLYLAIVLVLMYFPSELIVGVGLWLIWLALVSDPARSTRGVVLATVLFGATMAFTHPALALMSLLYTVLRSDPRLRGSGPPGCPPASDERLDLLARTLAMAGHPAAGARPDAAQDPYG
jgi:hypothetical protein